jgi:Toxin co-regulated pilus biosynthesis protein Q
MSVFYKQFASIAIERLLLPCFAGIVIMAIAGCSSGPRPVLLPDGQSRIAINEPINTIPSAEIPDLTIEETPVDVQVRIAATPTNPKAAIIAPVAPEPEQIWQLKKGETIRSELTKWAKDSGWSLVWQLDKDWMIPANSEFTGSFDVAAAKVIETLASNGVLIHASFYTANKTLVITGPGVTPQ